MRKLGITHLSAQIIDVFCTGAEDGAKNDAFRYLLSFTLA